jgi:hypothetical protein
MKEKLRTQYLEYLALHGIRPREVPPNADALRLAAIEYLKASSEASGHSEQVWLDQMYQETDEYYRKDPRHPAIITIEMLAEEVEQAIRGIEKYRRSLTTDVYAGEFPTGSINAQAVKVDDGFLMLINSGLMTVLTQVAEFLVAGDPDKVGDKDANRATIDGIVGVLEAYLRFGDPFLGPRPMSGAQGKMFAVHTLAHATQRFVVAHEYGHVIAGHLDDHVMRLEQLDTRVGPISVIKKEDLRQELEADVIAHKILLGVEDYKKIDLDAIDKGYERNVSGSDLIRAFELKAAIAAPFFFFTIDIILNTVAEVVGSVLGTVRPENDTHPLSTARFANLWPSIEDLDPKYSGFINFALILWPHFHEICKRLIEDVVKRA